MTRMTNKTIDICVCTFQRSQLAATLRSVGEMRLPSGYITRIIVSDNDETESARTLVERISETSPLPIIYVHAPARNISIARNACLDTSDADLVAFIDDDEEATTDWLFELVREAETSGADAVLGPVRAIYRDDAPNWMRAADFHSTFPVWVNGEIRTGYTCNVLMDSRSPHVAGRRFNLERGQTGGEDTEFFADIHQTGGYIAFASRAWVEEAVPDSRANLRWLARRRFRMGQTHGRLLAQDTAILGRLRELALVSAKIAYSFASAIAMAASPAGRNRGLLRGIMHAGVAGGLLGSRELRQYGNPSSQGAGGTSSAVARSR